MISIQMDKRSKCDKTGDWGYWGKKSMTEQMTVEELMEKMGELNYMGMHELLTATKYRPYADLDEDRDLNEDNFEARRYEILKKGYDTMERLFPKGFVYTYCSSGKKPDGKLKVSAHFVVNGLYYSDKEHIRYILEQGCDMKAIGFDPAVYNKNHLMRLPFCTKPGDVRALRFAEIKSIGDAQFIKYEAMDETTIATGLITGVDEDDEEMMAPAGYKPKERKVDEDDEDGEADDNWKSWTFEKAKAVIMRLKDDRAATHNDRINGICSILHLGKMLRKSPKFRELAHLFAKKDPNYSEAQTDHDYDYFKRKASGTPRTFASLIKQANEDNPVAKIELDSEEIPLSDYDKKTELLASKPSLVDVQRWMMGCLRFCGKNGVEEWFQHSSDGWHPLRTNKHNFPFGSTSSNSKFDGSTFFDILEELKDTNVFTKHCMTDGAVFYPYYGQTDRPDIINTFRGWPWIAGPSVLTNSVKLFRDHLHMLFGQECGAYVLNTLTRKLLYPRERGVQIIGWGQFGGEGKNIVQMILTPLFGKDHCLSSPGTKNILGQGEAGYNAQAERALVVFVQEAKENGGSIVCDDKYKTWLSEPTQPIRKMRTDPYEAANYGTAFIWTNNMNCLKMDSAMARRTMAQKVNSEKMDDVQYFNELVAVSKNDDAIQEIFNWLIAQDISKFNPTQIPQTDFMRQMKDDSLTPIQQYVVALCNGDRSTEFQNGNAQVVGSELYADYRAFCNEQGMQTKYVKIQLHFRNDLKNLDIAYKQLNSIDGRPYGFDINLDAVEVVMRKYQKNREWKLLRVDEH